MSATAWVKVSVRLRRPPEISAALCVLTRVCRSWTPRPTTVQELLLTDEAILLYFILKIHFCVPFTDFDVSPQGDRRKEVSFAENRRISNKTLIFFKKGLICHLRRSYISFYSRHFTASKLIQHFRTFPLSLLLRSRHLQFENAVPVYIAWHSKTDARRWKWQMKEKNITKDSFFSHKFHYVPFLLKEELETFKVFHSTIFSPSHHKFSHKTSNGPVPQIKQIIKNENQIAF